jgi:hypothetical protein
MTKMEKNAIDRGTGGHPRAALDAGEDRSVSFAARKEPRHRWSVGNWLNAFQE